MTYPGEVLHWIGGERASASGETYDKKSPHDGTILGPRRPWHARGRTSRR